MERITPPPQVTNGLDYQPVTVSTTASLAPSQSQEPLQYSSSLSWFKVVSLSDAHPGEQLLKASVR